MPYRYWFLTAVLFYDTGFAFSEIEFRTVRGTPQAFTTGSASAYSTLGGVGGPHDASKAADGNPDTYYSYAPSVIGPDTSEYWCWDYGPGGGVDVVEAMLRARNDDGYAQCPRYIQLEGGNTAKPNEAPFLYGFTADLWTTPGQVQVFTIPLPPVLRPMVLVMA